MIILGVDPGLTSRNPLGLALVDTGKGALLDHRAHPLDESVPWQDRLASIMEFLDGYLSERQAIEAVAYEIPFSGPNRMVGIMLAHVGGLVRALAWLHELPCAMVHPAQAKIALSGKGNASKDEQIQAALERYGVELSKDAADAVGVALAGAKVLEGNNE